MPARPSPPAPCLPTFAQILGVLGQVLEIIRLGNLGHLLPSFRMVDLDAELLNLLPQLLFPRLHGLHQGPHRVGNCSEGPIRGILFVDLETNDVVQIVWDKEGST